MVIFFPYCSGQKVIISHNQLNFVRTIHSNPSALAMEDEVILAWIAFLREMRFSFLGIGNGWNHLGKPWALVEIFAKNRPQAERQNGSSEETHQRAN